METGRYRKQVLPISIQILPGNKHSIKEHTESVRGGDYVSVLSVGKAFGVLRAVQSLALKTLLDWPPGNR